MALGKSCACCGSYLVAVWELYQREGTWVTYVCRHYACKRCDGKCRHSLNVFEPSSLTPARKAQLRRLTRPSSD